ncbi:kinase-like protein [Paraphaeosphaeria sporulosa]|uniref:Kinase-like protein n=1 Tax=Paraphaeosphaeria sporulosa TaxID=1460663 RepID=A0A177BWZ2_9PLEO|nr:kinase-like protein [Paraphaeosphaeria sporulosa]OAF99480.1 kinase-like protein [Paraphaeosphaeria sporulosa]
MPGQPHKVYPRPEDVPYQHIQPIGHGGQASVDSVKRKNKRIHEEVRIANGLVHPHIVRLIETYQCKNMYAIIMEPVAQGNLAAYLSDLDELPVGQDAGRRECLAQWFYCLTNALYYIHESGIRHRDIKPQNILTLDGFVYLTDFSISETFQEATISGSTEIVGTRTYRSPERDSRKRSGRREDIFSLGAVFLEMLTAYTRQGMLKEWHDFRGGPYCHKIDKIEQWIQRLHTVSIDMQRVTHQNAPKMPFWYGALLSLCGFMLEQQPKNRPHADVLVAAWRFRAISFDYKTYWLPIAQCDCGPLSPNHESRPYHQWTHILRILRRSNWSPERDVIEARNTITEEWYKHRIERLNVCQELREPLQDRHQILGENLGASAIALPLKLYFRASLVLGDAHLTTALATA